MRLIVCNQSNIIKFLFKTSVTTQVDSDYGHVEVSNIFLQLLLHQFLKIYDIVGKHVILSYD